MYLHSSKMPEFVRNWIHAQRRIGYKIREAQMQKVPYMLVVGAKEEESGLVSVRSRFEGDEGQKSTEEFIAALKEEIAQKIAREVKHSEEK